jgi:hypothetical protein
MLDRLWPQMVARHHQSRSPGRTTRERPHPRQRQPHLGGHRLPSHSRIHQASKSPRHTHLGDDDFSPTKALPRLVHEIQDLHESTNLGTYQEAGQVYQVTNKDIILTVWPGAILDDLGASGFDQTHIGTHSLRSGGATRLCLEGYNRDLIQHLGRWSSDTYLKYIQPQVAQLSAGASAHMATTRRYNRVDTNTGAT